MRAPGLFFFCGYSKCEVNKLERNWESFASFRIYLKTKYEVDAAMNVRAFEISILLLPSQILLRFGWFASLRYKHFCSWNRAKRERNRANGRRRRICATPRMRNGSGKGNEKRQRVLGVKAFVFKM